ncbi:MAG: asparagine synthase (glutamine-hydrolyzing) [Rhodospirillales bacterium]|nr:asparagine synthase (glutamine-hydrolyzing) [Rhodospirillales bacterium]
MCGIAAIFAYKARAPRVSEAELGAINAAMARRGPDGEGAWTAAGGQVGLAHRRLAIIDLSADAAQPMALDSAGLRITYNGEIYNFRALRRELESQGRTLRTQSDTEVLLHLYDRDGPGMVKHLRGMYALALWDDRRRTLLLARDPFGIKPLYYSDDGETIRAASQVKALLAGGAAGRSADAAGHVGFFLFGSVPEPHTLYADIQALPPGHTLEVAQDGGRRLTRFFDPVAVLATGTAAAAPDLGALLRDSISHHLVADVPVGVFLSGGLDSATITALASEVQGTRLDTITLGFEEFAGTALDETVLAGEVARAYGTRHHSVRVSETEFHERMDDVLACMDQPSIDGVNTYFVAHAAAEVGLKVALSGLGGDELFQGYDTFRQVPRLAAMLGPIPGAAGLGELVRELSASLALRLGRPKAAGLLELGTAVGDAYLMRRGLFMPWELSRVLDPEMALVGLRALSPRDRLAVAGDGSQSPRIQVTALELCWYMRNQLLRDADWAGMAHSVEVRVPLVDEVLFRALAPGLAHDGAHGKRKMALTPKRRLPEAVLDRPKSGFFVPVDRWLKARSGGKDEPGLRGWAKAVYAAFQSRSVARK